MKTIRLRKPYRSLPKQKIVSQVETIIIALLDYNLYKEKNIAYQTNGSYTFIELSCIQTIKKLGNKSTITCLGENLVETPYPFSFWEKTVKDFDFFRATSDQLINKLNQYKV